MKALLVNVDLMARVVVPDNATDEQILEATIERITYLVNQDRYFVSEGVTKWVDDTEVPYGESPTDTDEKKIVGYQLESADGKHDIPEGLHSFEVFRTTEAVENWSDEHQLDGNWKVVPVYDGDIEDFSYIN